VAQPAWAEIEDGGLLRILNCFDLIEITGIRAGNVQGLRRHRNKMNGFLTENDVQ
jgi:hypothetical protein